MAETPKNPTLLYNAGKIGKVSIEQSTLVGVDAVQNVGDIESISVTDTIHAKDREGLLAAVIAELLKHDGKLGADERATLVDMPVAVAKSSQSEVASRFSFLAELAKKVASTAAEEGVKMLMRAYGLAP